MNPSTDLAMNSIDVDWEYDCEYEGGSDVPSPAQSHEPSQAHLGWAKPGHW